MISVMNESKMFNNVTNSFFPKMNLLEHIYLLVRIKDDPIKTSVICSNLCVDSKFPYRVFHDVKIDYLTNLDPYKNNSLQMTLKVHHKDTTVEWITMKRSSIRNGGFGIFACRTFNVGELVTVYLGEMVPVMYRFQDIIAIHPKKKNGCFHDEYWFAHRINHKSGDLPNCRMNTCGVIRATKQIGLETKSLLIITGTVFARHARRIFIFLIWIHQLWKFVLIATKDVIVGKVAKNASNYFVYFVMIISKLMLKLLMFSLS
jgi:hypothetical protein